MLHSPIRPAVPSDLPQLTQQRSALWPESSLTEHADELKQILAGRPRSYMPLIILVAELEKNVLAGFVEVGLRSCAEGCDPSRPVGYVEGWYVAERYRRPGIGAALVAAAENWARRQNCREMASDAQLHNRESQNVHVALGFEEVERSVNYRKTL